MHLLVAIDGSDPAERALDHALDLADATGGSVTVAHVVQPDVYAGTASEPVSGFDEEDRLFVAESVEDAEERGQRLVDDAAETAADRDVSVETVLLYGRPVTELASYADREGFDGLVVGHRGLSNRAEELVGSTAKELVARATVPVTVVR